MNHRNKTPMPRKEDVKRKWFVFDAAGKTLGRFASEISKVLRGRHKPDFTSHVDTGDGVIIINAEKIQVTGNKKAQKLYTRHTGYIGGLRQTVYAEMMQRNPTYILRHAIKGMMPKTSQARKQLKRLRIVAGSKAGYQAQQPVEVDL